jgi:hypothetical protein
MVGQCLEVGHDYSILQNSVFLHHRTIRKKTAQLHMYVCTRVGQRLALAPRPVMIYSQLHKTLSIYLSIYLPKYLSIYSPKYLSITLSKPLQPFVITWPLFQFPNPFTQSVRLPGREMSPSQDRYLHT